MELSEMTPEHLLRDLEHYVLAVGWQDSYVQEILAAIKKRCDAGELNIAACPWGAACRTMPEPKVKFFCPQCGRPKAVYIDNEGVARPARKGVCYHCEKPACPCPVVGKGPRTWGEGRLVCPKCRNSYPVSEQPRINDATPCLDCTRSRLPAPSGYEFVGEWDKPNGRPFISAIDGLPCTVEPPDTIDGGKRWILRKLGEPSESWARATVISLEDLVQRLKKLEQAE